MRKCENRSDLPVNRHPFDPTKRGGMPTGGGAEIRVFTGIRVFGPLFPDRSRINKIFKTAKKGGKIAVKKLFFPVFP